MNSLLTDHSELCFDFPSDDEGREAGVTRDLAQAAGEAMQACYSVSEMTEILDCCGYRIRTMLGPEEMTRFIFPNTTVMSEAGQWKLRKESVMSTP